MQNKTWTCPQGHINSINNKTCPICELERLKEERRLKELKPKKKYVYEDLS